jgi:signal transduction histidine kinase
MVPQVLRTILTPEATAAHDLGKLLDLLLHELRTPVGVAQGYLRLLVENRLTDTRDQQRALAQSLEALGRIGTLCGSAGEYLHAAAPSELVSYPVSELVTMLLAEFQGRAFAVNLEDAPIEGHVRSLPPARAAAAITTVLEAALRAAPALTQAVRVGVHDRALLLTTGDEATREQLLVPSGRALLNPWRGGTGLVVPLALRSLAQTPLRIWTLSDEPGAVALAIPLETHA